jgi:hypothetical protein
MLSYSFSVWVNEQQSTNLFADFIFQSLSDYANIVVMYLLSKKDQRYFVAEVLLGSQHV